MTITTSVLPAPLTDTTMASLTAFFDTHDNRPSTEHLAALRAVAATMEAMADGTAAPSVFLSALDPGIGKTQTTIWFSRALVASPAHRGVGMIICLGRKSQISDIARALDLPAGTLAVLTADDELKALFPTPVEGAQVLLTTQQMVEKRTHGGQFETQSAFFYQGAPRRVRVWDEAIEWAAPISLMWSGISSLTEVAMHHSPAFAAALLALAAKVEVMNSGEQIDVPDFEGDHGISWRAMEADLATGGDGIHRDRLRKAARDLRV